ncbi:lactonase family protein [Paenibacillus sp. GCM10023252]|uniref:lactonase family protein n=1 Tax=Paenibacillus sp. GCM10023252 TaxID=3252649 RepID=UPI00360D1ED9
MSTESKYSGLLYIGSYGAESEPTIHVCSFDGETGQLEVIQALAHVDNASYLTLHPGGGTLYATSETDTGEVAALRIDRVTGKLSFLNERGAHGGYTCYVSTDAKGQVLLASNYGGGNIAMFPTKTDGQLDSAAVLLPQRGDSGPNKARQEGPHPHAIVPHPTAPYVYVPDLGLDSVFVYKLDASAGTLTLHSECKLPAGGGPRHLVFHRHLPIAYVMNEMGSAVSVLRSDEEHGLLEQVQHISSLPEDYDGYNDSADIHLSPSGRYLYCSNRGHNSLTVFRVDQNTGQLSVIQHVSSGGETPRNFAITPDGAYLLAANQDSDLLVLFAIDKETGKLHRTGKSLSLPKPVCVKFS